MSKSQILRLQRYLQDTRFSLPKIVPGKDAISPYTPKPIMPQILPYTAIREPDMALRLTQQLFDFLDSPATMDDILVPGAVDSLATRRAHVDRIQFWDEILGHYSSRVLPVLRDLFTTFETHADSTLLLLKQRNLHGLHVDQSISSEDKTLMTVDQISPSLYDALERVRTSISERIPQQYLILTRGLAEGRQLLISSPPRLLVWTSGLDSSRTCQWPASPRKPLCKGRPA
ncbi:hypothetical protein BT69DRAFT_659602 [Atractiella rhizophila]|nr:hypothetical protein BT69DRAFT_659602 [Atractiella rhizophila]